MPTLIKIKPDFIKLDSFLKLCNACSTGGEAKMAIQDGEVLVNGTACTMRGKKLYKGDKVMYDDNEFEVIY